MESHHGRLGERAVGEDLAQLVDKMWRSYSTGVGGPLWGAFESVGDLVSALGTVCMSSSQKTQKTHGTELEQGMKRWDLASSGRSGARCKVAPSTDHSLGADMDMVRIWSYSVTGNSSWELHHCYNKATKIGRII